MAIIKIEITVYAEKEQISQEELTDIESSVEETLTEWGHKHDLADAQVR